MEDYTESTESSLLPLALVLLAILLGGAGLYLGLTATQQLAPLKKSADEGTSSAARIDKQLSKIDTRINELSAQNAKLKEITQRLGRESSQILRQAKQVSEGVQSNRGELIELAEKVSQFATSVAVTNASSSRLEATSTGIETSCLLYTSPSPRDY